MIALNILDKKSITSHLFVQQTFDKFLLTEAEIVTALTFRIDGSLNLEYFSEEARKALTDISYDFWEQVRPVCFSLIKGHKLPLSFKLVLKLPLKQTAYFINKSAMELNAEQTGLFINIKYEKEQLTLITGTALSTFTLDKSLDQLWDHSVRDLLVQREINFEDL